MRDFVTAPFQLAADVADAATFTINYPAGYNQGHFENAVGHYIMLNGSKLRQPQEIGLAFAAGLVTVTNRTGGTLIANTKGVMQFELLSDTAAVKAIDQLGHIVNVDVSKLVPVLIDLGAPAVADADGICVSQSIDAVNNGLINGALAVNSVGVLDAPRNVVAAWTGAAVITVTGIDGCGQQVVEQSANGTSLTGKKAFKTVTAINFSANVTLCTVGTGDVLGLPVRISDQHQIIGEMVDGVYRPARSEYVRIPFQLTEAELDAGGSFYVPTGFAGKVADGGAVVENTVTTGGTIGLEINNVAVAGFGLVVADGAVAGTQVVDNAVTGDGTETFTAVQPLEIVVPAAFNASAPINGFIGATRTQLQEGTLVAGLAKNTKSTATTADARGTYDPVAACDGAVSFQLLALLPDPNDIGNVQYYV